MLAEKCPGEYIRCQVIMQQQQQQIGSNNVEEDCNIHLMFQPLRING